MSGTKNYCVWKALGAAEAAEACRAAAEAAGAELAVEQTGADYRLVLTGGGDSVSFRAVADEVGALLGEKAYAEDDVTPEECLIRECTQKGVKLSVAESLTGGMVCARLVDVAGASNVLTEGFVTYGNEAKVRRLHVKLQTLEQYGAVSRQTAVEMIAGQNIARNGVVALATTGCAGPSSDEKDTPVGLVYIAVGDRKGTHVEELDLEGGRNYIRTCAADSVLVAALRFVRERY